MAPVLSVMLGLALATDAGVSRDAGVESDAGIRLPPPMRANPLAQAANEERVQRVFHSLDTRAKAGQLVLAYPQISRSTPVEVGGVLFVGNLLRNVEKAKARVDWSRAHAKIPPFFATDMEGGGSNRMKSVRSLRALPSAKEMAELSDAEVKRWGKKVGEAMREIGLNMNLAPVLDVAADGHMARNLRSFGGDPDVVVKKASAYARGLLEIGVVPIGKHFPGYGDIDGDSDHGLVSSEWDQARVQKEMDVFHRTRDLLAGAMLANVAYPAVNAKPAILSPELVGVVHEHDWVAVTDDISIQVLADAIGGTSEDVLVQAFLAGNDVLLTTAPPDWEKGIDPIGILTKLAESNDDARAKLDIACLRVLRLKDRMGLLDGL